MTDKKCNPEFEKGGSCDCTERVNHIKCEVKNCCYHDAQDICRASMIEVTPSFAESEYDTACSTFKAEC